MMETYLKEDGATRGKAVCVRLSKGASQSIATGTFTSITWGVEHDDDYGFHAAGSASLYVPVGLSGRYLISLGVSLNGGTAAFRRLAYINVNGTSIAAGVGGYTGYGDFSSSAYAEVIVPLRAGAVVEGHCYQDSGGTLNINGETTTGIFTTFLNMVRLGDI